jgi:hypothetical protein
MQVQKISPRSFSKTSNSILFKLLRNVYESIHICFYKTSAMTTPTHEDGTKNSQTNLLTNNNTNKIVGMDY